MTPEEVVAHIDNGGRCHKHPRYQRKRKPKTLCATCWFLFFIKGLRDRTLDIEMEGKGEAKGK